MARPESVLRPGDWVHFDNEEHQVVGLAGTSVRLRSETGAEQVVLAGHLMASPGFAVVDADPAPAVEPFGLLDSLPDEVLATAKRWEQHLVEVETGLSPDAEPGTPARPGYDPAVHSLTHRQRTKAAELGVTERTIEKRRARYLAQGLWGLVDQRAVREWEAAGRVDAWLVDALREVIAAETDASTGTRSRLIRRTVRSSRSRSGSAAWAVDVLRLGGPSDDGQAHLRLGRHPPPDGEPSVRSVHADLRRSAR